MAQTRTKTRTKTPTQTRRVAATKKSPSTRRQGAAKGGENRLRATVSSTTELSEGVLKSVEDGQRAAIEAVHKFVDTVDRALPPRGKGPSRREEIVDSALEMADRLVHTQYDFLRNVVHSAGKSLSESDRAK
jgi:hypothetical protein